MYSPGVEVQEIDVSQVISSLSDITIACYVGNFSKGPIDSYIVISDITDFISVYGYPNFINYNDWYQVYNYLSYGSGIIAICRIGGTDITQLIENNTTTINTQESTYVEFQVMSASHTS